VKNLYYITSHGYGHAMRASAICAMLPPDTEIVFRTTVPLDFFSRELKRPFTYEPAVFDCGCIQPEGNTIDIQKTLATYRKIADRNRGLLDKEAIWCKKSGVDVIVSDIVPFAFDVANKAGIPSVAVTNFTWHTIYEEYAALHPEFAPYLSEIRRQYALADVLLAMYPANDMGYFKKQIPVGPVGRIGTNIRARLYSHFGIAAGKKIGLIYTGNFGMEGISWERLEMFDEWEFFGLYPLAGASGNYHYFTTREFRYQDCIASADVMITKLGYGACAECFINGLPIIYLPRTGFAEYSVLEQAVKAWGHGYLLSKDDYCCLRWQKPLHDVIERGKPSPMPSDGALRCAEEISTQKYNSRFAHLP
jgi:hypothetical protein